jgi:hypothetical protein
MCCFWFLSNHSRIARLNISQMTWQQRSEWSDRVNACKIEISLHLITACNAWDEKLMKIIVCNFYLRKQWIRKLYDFRDFSSTSIFFHIWINVWIFNVMLQKFQSNFIWNKFWLEEHHIRVFKQFIVIIIKSINH